MPPFPIQPFVIKERLESNPELFILFLEPASGEPIFSFQPGQWVMLHADSEDGTIHGKAAFSIANAPCESQKRIEIAIQVYGDFTKRLSQLRVGEIIGVQGPFGVFVLKPGTAPLVFFAGGIGVTPLRCMIRQNVLLKDPRPMTLFYSNRTVSSALYDQEFRELKKIAPQFQYVSLLTRETPASWDGVCGRLTEGVFDQFVPDPAAAEYFMCGPKEFMSAVETIILDKGIEKKKLKRELFH